MTKERDLNKLSTTFFYGNSYSSRILGPSDYSNIKLRNHTTTSQTAKVTTHFESIEDVFVELCLTHEIIVGAVAWLTNYPILSAMAQAKHIAIVVQKEDFLRRDAGVISYPNWKRQIHSLYDKLKPFDTWDFSETYPGQQEFHPQFNSTSQHMLFNASGEYKRGGEAVTCMGYSCDTGGRDIPRMHHKFLIFGDQHEGLIMWPRCVATGSFNLTHNATRSRENIVVIEDKGICQSYLSEWAQLWCMSESLNWSNPEPSPSRMEMGT